MLPVKITELLVKLTKETESGNVIWEYDDFNTSVSLRHNNFNIKVEYSFNMIEEVGQFRIVYLELSTNSQRIFSTNQLYNDYEIARRLFDSAQSSGLDIDF
ncbi:hypothetical protein ACED66_19705 [Vibrio splendidus]|jgi:hypothetical protein|uniref:hypothetical protein n=1 Tax=Vibrio splendidus TaxID=29497 RepID=UPI000D373C50|nr:hypothetical protein [Vibrio splendidus]PTO54899.1 hypothetical protein CWN82_18330 [Vibrio splendidus]PTO99581.1 hypothetical protein CWN88_17775 [Vibrio splendidus]PTQ02512.1 hypothetical protein CWO28_16760 [Vibrio splendidus]